MTTPDLINAVFEAVGGAMGWLNVAQLYRDKAVRGVNRFAIGMFTAWGFWNLFYYPQLGQWLSFGGGLVIVSANAAWLTLAIKYRRG